MLSSGSSYWNLFSQEDQSSSEYETAEEQNAEEQSAEDPSIVSSDVKWLEENSQFNNNWALVV